MRNLILLALKDEAPSLFTRPNVFEIGVGKVASAINTIHLINSYKPDRIINLGTAGSKSLKPDLYRVNKVIQHDVNLMALDLPPAVSLKDNHTIMYIPGDGYTCASGDLFVTEWDKIRISCHMIDMEAYSVVRAAMVSEVEVEVWNHISDAADDNSNTSWEENIAIGEKKYIEILETLNVEGF